MTHSELLPTTVFLLVVLVVTIGGWFLLTDLSSEAREKDPAKIAKGPSENDYNNATKWAKDLLGLAATFAGFLGIAAASQRRVGVAASERARSAESGMVGVLGGATLLGVGDWGVPVALATLVIGSAAVRVVSTLREKAPS